MKKAKNAGSIPSKSDTEPNKSNREKAQSSKVISESISKSPKTAKRSLNGVPELPLSAKSSEKKQRNPFQTNDIILSIDFLLTDDEETEPIVPVQNAELGPTPQANGKVLSIFDLMLSPPESSPIQQWKIKPRKDGEAPDSFDGKDVHEEMQKLDTADRLDLARYIDDEESEEEESEEEEVVARKTPASTKLHSISNNYQRLKINDPRSKKFKQGMKRR
ncbi:hypothetical protein HF325_006891 [Metschnikowia pulcherrima]|uniref:Uncharacterized protein n=1 Tax=Metschnikowia pulcherrima TaxID=27326 RepID=A0A8H7LB48_9ASCO|nr:hypothetical protein HF325_006891 [Metschnikowia pulcherrima]